MAKKKSSKKSKNLLAQILLATLLVVISAFGFLSLLFEIVDYKLDVIIGEAHTQITGYSALENVPLLDCGEWLNTYSIIYMVLAGLAVLIAIGGALMGKLTSSSLHLLPLGLSFVGALVYMINGFIAVGEIKESIGDVGSLTTLAYIPLIIVTVLSLLYVAIKGKVKK